LCIVGFILQPFRKKTPIGKLDEQPTVHPAQEKEPLAPWPGGVNPNTGFKAQLVANFVYKIYFLGAELGELRIGWVLALKRRQKIRSREEGVTRKTGKYNGVRQIGA
jgi:hypothetical protein